MPEVAESTVSKIGGKPSPGRRCPSGRMSGEGKCSSLALTHRLRRHPSRRVKFIPWMMDSATPPCGCAQNDGIAGSIQVSDGIEGSLHSCSYGADFTHLTLAVCEQHEDRAEKYVIAHFLSSCASVRWICPTKNHLFTK